MKPKQNKQKLKAKQPVKTITQKYIDKFGFNQRSFSLCICYLTLYDTHQ